MIFIVSREISVLI